jgi:L-rhamnose-H+ transport protein
MKGILTILFASVFNGNFTLPMKFTRKWEWEHAWLMWAFWACLVLPVALALISVPGLVQAYKNVPFGQLLLVFAASIVWGLSAIAFGLGVRLAGMAIGFAVIMGLVITTGTLVPLFTRHPEVVLQPTGLCIILGEVIMVAGIVLCARGGLLREGAEGSQVEGEASERAKTFRKGLIMCVLAGVFGPMINFSFIFGEPIKQQAIELGANPLWATNAIWCLTLFGGFVTNAGYCAYLITKRKSWGKLVERGTGSHWLFGFAMGLFFMAGIMFYGVGTAQIGALGASIGWAIFQGPTIIIANLSGLATGEWKNAGRKARLTMLAGVVTLLVGIVVVAAGKTIGD